MTGLGLGYSKIYLCGVPLDNGPHYFDPPWTHTNFERSGGLREWQNARDRYFEGRVVSMLEGGYNLQALGESVKPHIQVLSEG